MKKVVKEFIKRRSQRLDSKRNDADKWITAHPNGEESTGVRIKINEQGEPTDGWAKKKGLNFSGAKSVPLSELKKKQESGDKPKIEFTYKNPRVKPFPEKPKFEYKPSDDGFQKIGHNVTEEEMSAYDKIYKWNKKPIRERDADEIMALAESLTDDEIRALMSAPGFRNEDLMALGQEMSKERRKKFGGSFAALNPSLHYTSTVHWKSAKSTGSNQAKKNSNPTLGSVDLTSKNVRGAIDSVVESLQSMGKRGKKNFHIGGGIPDVTVSKAGGGYTVFDNTNGENTGEHTFYGENAIEDVRHYFHDILVKKSKK